MYAPTMTQPHSDGLCAGFTHHLAAAPAPFWNARAACKGNCAGHHPRAFYFMHLSWESSERFVPVSWHRLKCIIILLCGRRGSITAVVFSLLCRQCLFSELPARNREERSACASSCVCVCVCVCSSRSLSDDDVVSLHRQRRLSHTNKISDRETHTLSLANIIA